MKDKKAYSYVVLRYRHDPLAGEFANVGVIVHSSANHFLKAKIRQTVGRLSKMFPDLNSEHFRSVLKNIDRSARALSKSESADLFSVNKDASIFGRQILPEDDSSFFWGQMGTGITDDPDQVLEKLYSRFVTRYDEKHKVGRDDAAIWKPVHDLLAARNLAGRLQSKVISSDFDTVEFQHAWKNGAWHCYQPLSFDLASDENIREKARRWAGTILSLSSSSESFKPHFLVGAPSNLELKGAYSAALHILKLAPVDSEIIEESNAEALAHQIEDEIRKHDSEAEAN